MISFKDTGHIEMKRSMRDVDTKRFRIKESHLEIYKVTELIGHKENPHNICFKTQNKH